MPKVFDLKLWLLACKTLGQWLFCQRAAFWSPSVLGAYASLSGMVS